MERVGVCEVLTLLVMSALDLAELVRNMKNHFMVNE
jgi:hypothetical protein